MPMSALSVISKLPDRSVWQSEGEEEVENDVRSCWNHACVCETASEQGSSGVLCCVCVCVWCECVCVRVKCEYRVCGGGCRG
jgi:hypothetical protein